MTNPSGPFLLGPEFAVTETSPVTLVAAQPPANDEEDGGRGADFGKSSPVGLLVMLLFLIAVAFLVRSMTKHLKRVPESFDPPPEPAADSDESGGESGGSADADEPADGDTKPKTTNGN